MTPAEITALRIRLGLSQTQFAKRVGATGRATVNHWEKGRRKPDRWFTQQLEHLAATGPGEGGKLE